MTLDELIARLIELKSTGTPGDRAVVIDRHKPGKNSYKVKVHVIQSVSVFRIYEHTDMAFPCITVEDYKGTRV